MNFFDGERIYDRERVAAEAFDGITYRKGAAILSMIERRIGADVFRQGIEAYLRENSWKAARADDLLRALSKASGVSPTSRLSRSNVAARRVSSTR